MIDDDYRSDEGGSMPAPWWRLPDDMGLVVRHRGAVIPGLPLLAFASEFHGSLSVHGPRYLSLRQLTCWDARRRHPTPRREAFEALIGAHPDTFSVVVGRDGPDAVWLALRLTRLTDPIVDTLLTVRDRTIVKTSVRRS